MLRREMNYLNKGSIEEAIKLYELMMSMERHMTEWPIAIFS
ncbi:uncharacterized protein METZ01_LOCUS437370 [marine metagenome]|uniref:Uncharacterized protein n=1 Tax=marine metagenome TaxID=408172 RepID=A0A382YMH5_9ZZZZ